MEIIPKASLIRVEAGGPPIMPTQLKNHIREKIGDQRRPFWFKISLRVEDRK